MTMPMSARRPSLSGVLGCNDHISPPLLKTELIDENSQNSIIAESMNHDSMDHFVVPNENSMDSNSAQQAPIPMQTTMGIMETNPIELIMHKNATIGSGFAATTNALGNMLGINATGIDLRVKQEEQIAAQIEELVNNPNQMENDKILSVVAQQSEQNVNKFLSNLDAKINDLKAQVEATTVSNSTSTNVVMFNNAMETMNQPNALVSTQIGHHSTIDNTNTFTAHQTLMTEAGTANNINHILSFPPVPSATTLMETSPTSQPAITQDVILNAQPSVVMNPSPGMLSVNSGSTSSLSPNMPTETDIIMNPTISPSMMCQPTTGDTNLISNQVPIDDSALLPVVTVGGAAVQASSPTLMNNMLPAIMPPATISPQNPESTPMHHIPMKQTPVAVKNMILNAAADILSCEPNSISTENTIHALMSLTTPTMTEVVHPEPALPQVTTTTNIPMMQVNDHPPLQTQVSNNEPILMPTHNPFVESQQTQSMNNMFTSTDATTAAAPVFSNPLIQNVVAVQNQIAATDAAMINNFTLPNMNMNQQMMPMQTTAPTNTLCQPPTTYMDEFR